MSTKSEALPPPSAQPLTGPWILLGALVTLLVLIFWMLFHFVVGPGLMSNVVRQRRAAAQTEILELHKALEAWSSRHLGNYPPALSALIEPDAAGHTLLGVLELPKDPWGHEFFYAPPTPGQLRPTVRSLGRDGRPGGAGEDADIDREGLGAEAR